MLNPRRSLRLSERVRLAGARIFLTFIPIAVCLFAAGETFSQTRAWGWNQRGQLGLTHFSSPQPSPQIVTTVTDATGIGGGYGFTIFLKADGTLHGTGSNGFSELGRGFTSAAWSTPLPVLNLTNITQVTAGEVHAAALRSDGTVWSWGYNGGGQTGNGTTNPGCACTPTPAQSSIADVVQIDAGLRHTLALKADGTVWAWGENNFYQLGDTTQTNRPLPVQVGTLVPAFNNIIAVSAGDR